ncbi:MAG: hypothetical protein IPM21_10910 [Acidobacteria bacterium]|nr:hypothetical protein [Acidobacteriota bacterium]
MILEEAGGRLTDLGNGPYRQRRSRPAELGLKSGD